MPPDPTPFITPPLLTVAAFVSIVATVAIGFVLAIRKVEPAWTGKATVGTAAWLVITGAASGSGILEAPLPVPPLMFFFMGSMGMSLALAFSRVGERLALGIPLALLIGIQGLRLPLEIVLHLWHEAGTIPVQMTWNGDNFDVITGIVCLGFAGWAWFREPPRPVAWFVNILGFILLMNVMLVALTSAPIPLRTYLDEPPLLVALYFPFGWIVPICVGGALLGHLVTFRALMMPDSSA